MGTLPKSMARSKSDAPPALVSGSKPLYLSHEYRLRPTSDTLTALAAAEAVEVELESDPRPGYVLPDDLAPVRAPRSWVALLPALDPTVMGWKQRDWYLGPHTPQLFDRNGNAGPTVWADGQIVGGWAQHPDGDVIAQLLVDVPKSVAVAIDREARVLTEWLAGTRVTPRFRTPIEKDLGTR